MNPTGKGGFQKGQSGNPGGRPAVIKTLQELARQHTEMAINTLATIAEKGKNESARITAASMLLDRAFGRPTQTTIAADVTQEVLAATDSELYETMIKIGVELGADLSHVLERAEQQGGSGNAPSARGKSGSGRPAHKW